MITPTTDPDAAIEAAERDAVVIWRGDRIPFRDLRRRIATTDGRAERDGLYAGWIEALEAMHPLYRDRHLARRAEGASLYAGVEDLALELERLALMSETVYYAALRRYLAQIGIEQGDATLADAWYMERGAAWSHWFGPREMDRAAAATGRSGTPSETADGWRLGFEILGADQGQSGVGAGAVGELHAWLVGDPAWLDDALRVTRDEIAPLADFVAFARLWELRRAVGTFQYEQRLYATEDESLQRAYFSGIVGHMTGVSMPEAAYLQAVGAPGSTIAELERSILAGAMAEELETRFGPGWWSNDEARAVTERLAAAATREDVLAQLGYDALDWRPLLRQIRTRLIGEMSGYGGPNITTRAGTRKV
ncbi:MAG: hypothetical protein K5924_06595 [Chloroflexi bacterium]|nr:hypothetical protein [Chloroflexota bacterium]